MKTDTISLDELRTIVHMSKRRLAYLLNAGMISCEIHERATHRYTIQRKDGLAFVEEYNRNPAKYATDGGIFTSVKANQGRTVITADPYRLRTYLSDLWQTSPELINAVDVMNMTGYNENTVRRWMKEERLRSAWLYEYRFTTTAWLYEYRFTTTAWLIDFLTIGYGATITGKSAIHKQLIQMT